MSQIANNPIETEVETLFSKLPTHEGLKKTSLFNGRDLHLDFDQNSILSQVSMTGILHNLVEVPGMHERILIFEFAPDFAGYNFVQIRNLPNHPDVNRRNKIEFYLSRGIKFNIDFERFPTTEDNVSYLIEPTKFKIS
ncbi:MAG: hypothetical protein ACRCXZ_06805 [Patescibacteria group bacterium]